MVSVRKGLVALIGLGWACSAFALGLGEIEVKSRLNQALVAVIPISSSTPKEMQSLTAQLASNEEFERSGVDRTEFLSSLKFEIVDNTIRVTSKAIAREPFVSFLLDVRWGGGHLLREYTVLLDPVPAMAGKGAPTKRSSPLPQAATSGTAPAVAQTEPAPAPQAQAQAPAAAETSGEPTATIPPPAGAEAAPAEKPAATAAEPETPAAPSAAGTYGPTLASETLWSIAYKLRPDPKTITMDQMQVAIFQANPKAFKNGQLGGLMKGSRLKIPSSAEIRAVDAASAKAMVAEARHGGGAAAPKARAAAPTPAPAAEASPEPAPAPAPAPKAETPAPQTQATPPPAESPKAETPPPAAAAAPVTPPPVAQAPPPSETKPAETPPAAGTAPATTPATPPAQAAEAPKPAETKPAETPPPVATRPVTPPAAAPPKPEEPGLVGELLDRAKGLSENPLFIPVVAGIFVLIALILAIRWGKDKYAQWAYRRAANKKAPTVVTSEADAEEPAAAAPSTRQALEEAVTEVAPGPQAFERTTTMQAPAATQTMVDRTVQSTVQQTVQQTMAHEPPAAQTGPGKVDFDVTGQFATETVQINLDAGDPVSEAEFHRAYGLYDEAALLLKQALEKDPNRIDARVKLAEIYFEANKAQEFVATARDLKAQLPAGEWGKIALMGSQLAPNDELFKGAEAAGTGGTVDLSFDEPVVPAPAKAPAAAPAPAADAGLEFNLEDIKMPEAPAAAAAAPAAAPAEGTIEFDLGSLSLDQPAAAAPAAPESPPAAAAPPAEKVEGLDLSGFDLQTPEAAPAPAGDEKIELSGADLAAESPAGAGDESSTKLDLARAYMDMGDNDMARSLLNEVLQQGSAAQKKEAQDLLQRVPA